MGSIINRRAALGGVAAGLLVGLAGCNRGESRAERAPPVQAAKPAMLVHRDPGCGCCEKWAQLAGAAGYAVRVVDEADMAAVKARLRVPTALASCHTAQVGGAVIEGHVPFDALAAFLANPPAGAIGLAVPGMPAGSPGMEVPGVPADPLVIHAFDSSGRSRVYTA